MSRWELTIQSWRADDCSLIIDGESFNVKLFDLFQVSPPTEHVILPENNYPWWQRYQPVSYKLFSRSGSEADFVDMVHRCNSVGVRYVHIISDVIHMFEISVDFHQDLRRCCCKSHDWNWTFWHGWRRIDLQLRWRCSRFPRCSVQRGTLHSTRSMSFRRW